MRKLLLSSVAALLVASPAAAGNGPYVGVQGGLNLANDADLQVDDTQAGGELDFSPGFTLGATAGWAVDTSGNPNEGLALRPELEISYRANDTDTALVAAPTVGNAAIAQFDGDQTSWTGMANLWLDYQVGRFIPYAGGGVGLSRVAWDAEYTPGSVSVDDSDTVFAYQAGFGSAYQLGGGLSVTADYRYYATADLSLEGSAGATSGSVTAESSNHTFMVGLRYGF